LAVSGQRFQLGLKIVTAQVGKKIPYRYFIIDCVLNLDLISQEFKLLAGTSLKERSKESKYFEVSRVIQASR